MIAFLKGRLTHKEPTHVIVEVHGVGYHVNVSLQTFGSIKDREEIFLHTYLAVREDAHVLYGFATPAEKNLFLQLITVNGVGPGTALVMLSYLTVEELSQAIAREDAATLQRIKGIGSKTAQRVIIDLKDRIRRELALESADAIKPEHNTIRQEALTALLTLGIPRSAAEKSVDTVLKKSGNTITLEDLIKQALKTT
ncbi:MAG: Holliday junction branch migration protein RuvA [Cyclobacteriaceae bacterium]|nr:Holliday junction branch migration protein RuvA [Cyclobacteriaceae bacterium]MCX7636750.1 Holliday junction branch migration protein RuvA [Cyclobacteriaceae bacterium]MDW8330645.1 Holliday junction branch migration protein RuvA [Cyclobacteriaceae bacterium]